MKFTTPCFVRVEDAEKRKELLYWLQWIGYDLYQSARNMKYPILCANMVDDEPGSVYGETEEELTGICRDTATNCGTDIGMFKALAAMNEENDLDQWFALEEEDMLFFCQLDSMQDYDCHYLLKYRKASVEEIIEHFKKMRR